MNINEITRVQTGLKQISQDNKVGKKIVENAEYNIINELMGKIKGKKGKSQVEKTTLSTPQANPAYKLSLGAGGPPGVPQWDNIWTKREAVMTDEEIENKMAELGREFAEKSVEIGNSGKPAAMINKELDKLREEYNNKQYDLERMYVSVVSPDRKAAYAKADFKDDNKVYGNERSINGTNAIMSYGPNAWAVIPTSAEMERQKKLVNIFVDTVRAYEAENGKIPHTTISNSWAV